MIGVQLRKMVLISLISSISIIPMMCEIVEDSEDIAGFSRFSKPRTSLEDDDQMQRSEPSTSCYNFFCTWTSTCIDIGCSGCAPTGRCY
ncbi:uncharacterized protein MELLADRAFT_124256 [Melampsora larici-populina 98AG31]|uniref:Secreted protein n=1 Tax=Melampsora larici-populina (strain 98AG31 / pathotype 3-4-7) TaxID=747676 RepID=F4RLW1_MELLP|nr:uncharacterized protein MELLADRAFT_124256 [Melampsora larici-populina 98AG31]EGG06689.1 secreted protein [Melampsora larici-populina 98AG31]